MKRQLIKANGTQTEIDASGGWKEWNKAIGADIGAIVASPDGSIELWCDDNGLLYGEPQLNKVASMLVRQQIVGDVIAFLPGDIT